MFTYLLQTYFDRLIWTQLFIRRHGESHVGFWGLTETDCFTIPVFSLSRFSCINAENINLPCFLFWISKEYNPSIQQNYWPNIGVCSRDFVTRKKAQWKILHKLGAFVGYLDLQLKKEKRLKRRRWIWTHQKQSRHTAHWSNSLGWNFFKQTYNPWPLLCSLTI